MATINASIDAEMLLVAQLNAMTVKNFDRPEADLSRWGTASLIPPTLPVLHGYPRQPTAWVRVSPQLSTDGSYVFGNRLGPDDLNTGADLRWLPLSATLDSSSGNWASFQTTTLPYFWTSVITTRPTLSSYTYRIGREILTVPVMTFAPGQFLISSFLGGLASATSFTLSMVVFLDAPARVPYPLLDWGIVGWNGVTQPPPQRTYIQVGERMLYGWSGSNGSVDTIVPMPSLRPAFITLTVDPPLARLYVSGGPRFTFSTTVSTTSDVSATPMQFYLGKSTQTTATGSFRLAETALWSRALSTTEVSHLNSLYSSAYGASSEW